MIRFAHPWFFLLLLTIIPVFFWGTKSGGRFKFSNLSLLKELNVGIFIHPRQILLILRIIAIVFFILALARPQSGKKFTKITSEGIDIMLLVDTSGSMQAVDFFKDQERVNRLTIVKDVSLQFIKNRPNDRIGVIVFGTDAYTQCPLTLDHGIVSQFLDKLEIGMAGEETAIGSAIGVGTKRMKDLNSKSKIMILVTDGADTARTIPPLQAAEAARTYNIKTYTIGVGTTGKAPFIIDHPLFGKRIQYGETQFDEETLKEIARITEGKYFAANSTDELENIYDEIDKLEKTKIEANEYTEYNEIFYIFLIIALTILLLEIILGNTLFRKIP